MSRASSRSHQSDPPTEHWSSKLLFWIVATAVATIPLLVAPGTADPYRYPKELILRATAIVAAAAVLTAGLLQRFRSPLVHFPKLVRAVLSVGALWCGVTGVLSTNRALSFLAAAYVATWLVFFYAALVAAKSEVQLRLYVTAIGSAAVNAVVAILQAADIWRPFYDDPRFAGRFAIFGLFGNPNDLASFLAISIVPTAAIAIAYGSRLASATVIVLFIAITLTQGLTALAALVPATGAMALLRFRNKAILPAGLVASLIIIVFLTVPPLRKRVLTIAEAAVGAKYDAVTSYRLVPFLAAWEMFKDRPLTGLGPGTFKWHYLDYRIRVELNNPERYQANLQNYNETHSDHLQLLAESGLPGYLIFLTALAALARRSFQQPEKTRLDETQRLIALPLALAMLVLTLSSFPTQLAGVMCSFLLFSAGVLRAS